MIACRKLAGGRAGRGEWDPDQGSKLVKIAIVAGRPARKDKGRGSIDEQRAGGGRPRSPASPNANLTPVPVPLPLPLRRQCLGTPTTAHLKVPSSASWAVPCN